MNQYQDFVPKNSIPQLQSWIKQLAVKIRVVEPRRTKLGDFRVQKKRMIISINNNLNPYSFLITLTHELAHAFVYVKYKNEVFPHGIRWQEMFKSMMLNFLSPVIFPNEVLKALSIYLKQPKASTYTDVNLATILKKYDYKKSLTITDVKEGGVFSISNGKIAAILSVAFLSLVILFKPQAQI